MIGGAAIGINCMAGNPSSGSPAVTPITLTASANSAAGYTKSAAKALAVTKTAAASLVKKINKTLTKTISGAANIASSINRTAVTYTFTLTASLGKTASSGRRAGKALSKAVVTAPTLARKASLFKILSVTTQIISSAAKGCFAALTASLIHALSIKRMAWLNLTGLSIAPESSGYGIASVPGMSNAIDKTIAQALRPDAAAARNAALYREAPLDAGSSNAFAAWLALDSASQSNAPLMVKEALKPLIASIGMPLVFMDRMTLLNLAAISSAALCIKCHIAYTISLVQSIPPLITKRWAKTIAMVKVKATSRMSRAAGLILVTAIFINAVFERLINFTMALFRVLSLNPTLASPKNVLTTLAAVVNAAPMAGIEAMKKLTAKLKASGAINRALAIVGSAIALPGAMVERIHAFNIMLHSEAIASASLNKLRRLVLTLTAIGSAAPQIALGAVRTLVASVKATSAIKRGSALVLSAALLPSAILERLHAYILILTGNVAATAAVDKLRRLVLVMSASAATLTHTSLTIFKNAMAKAAATPSMQRLRTLTLTALQASSAALIKVLSLLRSIISQVLTDSALENVQRRARALIAVSVIQGSRALTICKALSASTRQLVTLNRHWFMTLAAASITGGVIAADYIQRLAADLARLMMAPLKRQPLKPEKEAPKTSARRKALKG